MAGNVTATRRRFPQLCIPSQTCIRATEPLENLLFGAFPSGMEKAAIRDRNHQSTAEPSLAILRARRLGNEDAEPNLHVAPMATLLFVPECRANDGRPRRRARRRAHSRPRRRADSYTNIIADALADVLADGRANCDTDGLTNALTDTVAYTVADAQANFIADRHPDRYADRQANRYADRRADRHADCDADRNTN